MPGPTDLRSLVEAWAPRLRAAFLAAVNQIRNQTQISAVVAMLEKKNVEGALEAVGLDRTPFRALDVAIGQGFEEAATVTMAGLPPLILGNGLKLKIGFNARAPDAENWLRDHSSKLVTEVLDDQRQTIRQYLTAGLQVGTNPRTVALDLVGRIDPATRKRIGGVIGLTSTQEAWARNYAAELDAGDEKALTRTLRDRRFDPAVRKAVASGQPIPAETQAAMVRSYRNRALKLRGDMIGRTEALTALHQGQHQGVQQAIAGGQISVRNVRKVWKSAHDDRVRETHAALDSESVAFDQPFLSPSGATLMFPGDPSAPASEVIGCRCAMVIRVDHLANVR